MYTNIYKNRCQPIEYTFYVNSLIKTLTIGKKYITMNNMLKDFIQYNLEYGFFYDNKYHKSKSGKTITIKSPIDNEIVGSLQDMTTDEVDTVVSSSSKAYSLWKNTNISDRSKILHSVAKIIRKNKYTLIDLLIKEVGKSYKESTDEVLRSADITDFYAEEGQRIYGEVLTSDMFKGYKKGKIAITKRVPIGIVLSIPPFNYPLNETIPKIVGALISGNTTILKAPSQGGITNIILGEIFREAKLPDGVLNIISGNSSIIGDYIVQKEEIQGINFTGGTNTAMHIQGLIAKRNKPFPVILMGLSGKDAAIVLKDADIDKTVDNIADGAFLYSGQRCTAIKRVLVEEDIADEFIKRLKEIVEKKYILGNPNDKNYLLGPVINDQSKTHIESLLNDALKKGAKLITGGKINGRYIDAIILDNVKDNMDIAWEEQFGPILPIIRVKNLDQAINIANKSEYGLQSSIFTKDINKAFEAAEKLEVGSVQINGKDSRGPDNFPFNGIKGSGYGNIQGAKYLIESLTRIKTTIINL